MATIPGTNGDDELTGTEDNDLIRGFRGDDTITGEGGNDQIKGGGGDDLIDAGNGSDTVRGGTGNDTITGGGDNDDLRGGDDVDTIIINQLGTAGVNNTTVNGGSGGTDDDTLNIAPLLKDGWVVTNLIQNPETNGSPGFNGQIQLQRGSESANINFSDIEYLVICFTPGTQIATPKGMQRVEDLRPGDRVITRDNGYRHIKWVGRRDLDKTNLMLMPHLQPILIREGAIEDGVPNRDLLVSPNHRVMVRNELAALMFGEIEVLVAAKHLTHLPGVDPVQTQEVSYIHLLFDQHEVILSDATWTESFQPGQYSIDGLEKESRDEIFGLFPELSTKKGLDAYAAVRRSLKAHEAKLLVDEVLR